MVGIYVNPAVEDEARRRHVFAGDILLYTGLKGLLDLCEHAEGMIREAFAPLDPERAEYEVGVQDFIARTGPLKSAFTNGDRTKELMRDFVESFGCDPDLTYFDLPRLRVIPSSTYLDSGVSYNYKAHRDNWYAHPLSLVNFWFPVLDISAENAMAVFPRYWSQAVANASARFDYDDWVANNRFSAARHVQQDERPHPLPMAPVDTAGEIRIVGRRGDVMVFSGCHLHASCPNEAGRTRFSIDFRTIHLGDVRAGRGAVNVDCQATGSTLGDFLRTSDLTPFDTTAVDVARAHGWGQPSGSVAA